MNEYSHLDKRGNPRMVDVSAKEVTYRKARAQARISLPVKVVEQFADGDIKLAKGPIFQTAILAGIQAVKQCSNLIPLCHPLPINSIAVDVDLEGADAVITCQVATDSKTGVEMEALTGASIAALTIYDMCKAVSHDMTIHSVQLIQKSGGKNDFERKT